MATVVSVNLSETKGVRKTPVPSAVVAEGGLRGDAHAGPWHRMVSLLALESIQKMRDAGLEVGPGDFAENLTTEGLDLLALPLGTRLRVGAAAILELTQHGKECHSRCAIYYQAGDCVMPREGVFAKVIRGGQVRTGDAVEVLETAAASGDGTAGGTAPRPWRVGVLTLSDKGARGQREDRSGAVLQEMLDPAAFSRTLYRVIPDEYEQIVETLTEWVDREGLDLVLTTGGTGVSPRDVTPEATRAVLHREVPGIGEAMRYASLQKTPHAVLSRGLAGIRGRCLIVNLPGSPKAARENLEAILPALPHALAKIHGDPSECAT